MGMFVHADNESKYDDSSLFNHTREDETDIRSFIIEENKNKIYLCERCGSFFTSDDIGSCEYYKKGEKTVRDKKRIKPFLKEVETLWNKFPDLRFGQLIYMLAENLDHLNSDIFTPEEDEWLRSVNILIKHYEGKTQL